MNISPVHYFVLLNRMFVVTLQDNYNDTIKDFFKEHLFQLLYN